MDTAHMLSAEAATKLASEMPAVTVEALAQAIQAVPASKAQAVQCIPHLHYRSLAAEFIGLWQDRAAEATPDAVALALRTASHAGKIHREAQTVELVWTGPGTEAHPFRRTEQAVLQVFDSARQRITLVSYAMGNIGREMAKDDFGLDGEIEVVTPKANGEGFETAGGIVKVQSKAGESYVRYDSDTSFSSPVDPRRTGPLPVGRAKPLRRPALPRPKTGAHRLRQPDLERRCGRVLS